MNPSGLMGDALRGTGFNNRQWDGIWNAKVVRSEIGWTIEIEIPFRTLNFDPNAEGWGINFQRTVRRKNEESVWTGWLRNQGLNRLSNAGLLTGLDGIDPGLGLDIKPYLVGFSETFPGRGDPKWTNDANAGVDVFYNPAPGVRTNLTINTDFAQTEVDQRLVNLTRFPTFFQERRDFFLDGSTFFDFQSTAAAGNSLLPYYSRRIGLDANNAPQKINVGGKLGGQFGTNDVGALYVRTGEENGIAGEDFAVLRGKHRMLRQSYVGGLYTGRRTRGSEAGLQNTLGADFLLATSTFRGGDNLSVGGFFVNTSNPNTSGKSNAFGAADRLSERSVDGEFALSRNPVELLRGGRVRAAGRLSPLNNGAVVHDAARRPPLASDHPVRRRRRLLRDSEDNTLLNRDFDLTADQRGHPLAGYLRRPRAADLRASRARISRFTRASPSRPAASTPTRGISFQPDRPAAGAGGQSDLRGRQLLRRHKTPHRPQPERARSAGRHYLHDGRMEPG